MNRNENILRFAALTAAVFAIACNDDGSGGAGDGGGGAGGATWESYCEEVFCARYEQKASELSCGYDDVECNSDCNQVESCSAQVKALFDCTANEEHVCVDLGAGQSGVLLANGVCLPEYNARIACVEGACDPTSDAPCGVADCGNGVLARMCIVDTCSSDVAELCSADRACESIADCPTLTCPDGSTQSGCQNGICKSACD